MSDLFASLVMPLLIAGFLLTLGFVVGRARERRHIANLEQREAASSRLLLTDLRQAPPGMGTRGAQLVTGSAVIASDYLKTFLSNFRMIFGGEMQSYATLIDRARREAKLRMVEDALRQGAVAVINIRFETSQIGATGGRNPAPMSEVLCYGTALLN